MSLLGAMDTAITGLNAQSAAFSNIGDNVANSQTIGFKETDTRFSDYLTSSTKAENLSGSVVATPDYQNTVQGTITQSGSPLAMAIAGQGFFPVSQSVGQAKGQPVFSAQPQYTRAGDFRVDQNGYIVNGGGQYLNAWKVDAAGNADRTQLAPTQVGQGDYSPIATSKVTLSANLPATPPSNTATVPLATQVPVYDALGTEHQLSLSWSQATPGGPWSVAISSPDTQPPTTPGSPLSTATVSFGTGALAGTVSAINGTTGTVGQPATFNITSDFGSGAQAITLNLGNFGQANGLTQFAGTDYSPRSVSQDGVPAGSFTGLTSNSSGDLIANYSNGQNTVIARIPVVTFANPDGLQRQNGQVYTQTTDSGQAISQNAGANAAGGLVTGSVEGSNVDIAKEFSKLIVAQRAYSANTKLVTTADTMLQDTIDMKR
jgi:flagellar hook protein FlgE